MKGGYESLIWVNDKDGKEYVCSLDDIKDHFKEAEGLTEEQRNKCFDVNAIVGTERW
ncbi:MAG: hypothetical protein KQH63_19945 [Desulfobulbaceae bacterium]|nr:hypothetical protein [Desulfobulbaceae bacterium]